MPGPPLVHALLETAMRGPARGRAHLERLANWLTVDNPELRRVVPHALDAVEAVMTAKFWQKSLAAEQYLVDVPFAVRVDSNVAPPRIIHGVIDPAFRTPSGWDLVDYKTDQIVPSIQALVDSYRSQVCTYGAH